MPDYKKIYFELFNAVTTAINQLQNAQRKGEIAYIESEDAPLAILPNMALVNIKSRLGDLSFQYKLIRHIDDL
jgi:hypothetical protein